jgi:uncharacterized membrane protein
VALGLIASWRMPPEIPWQFRAVAGWDIATVTLLAFAWTTILRADAEETKRRAGDDDPGHYAVFLIAILTSLISLFAAAVVLRGVKVFPGAAERTIWMVLTLAAISLSWAVTHTAYTFRYAHGHYQTIDAHGQNSEGDLKFGGPDKPSDFDFAYFAFTIGMCFQVSDVIVITTGMRHVVLVHAMLSFVYNTTILALALNVVAGGVS